jgi:hypothetical protein
MRRTLLCCAVLSLSMTLGCAETLHSGPYPDRFVFLFGWSLDNRDEVTKLIGLVREAAKAGYTGAVLPGFDNVTNWSPATRNGVLRVKKACERCKLELIPSMFSPGYGSVLGFNRNLAEGLPVLDAPFEVRGSEARLVPDPTVSIPNGGFEESQDDALRGFGFQDDPGVVSFVDTQVKHSGSASLRLGNFTANPNLHARINLPVKVHPNRCYRVSAWVKTEGLQPTGVFRLLVLAGERDLDPRTYSLPTTGDWQQVTLIFNSAECSDVLLYAGMWGGQSGKLWIDDWKIEELGPMNLLRRPGTPIAVRSEDGSVTYEEGKDFARFEDPELHPWRQDREAIPLHILPDGRIKDGQRLRVSWYHSMVIYDSQVGTCMAEPEVYEIWAREAKAAVDLLHPRRVLMNMDEIRMGGTCAACRGKDMAKLLGECMTKGHDILRRLDPKVQVYVWSDMLDPNHNAHKDFYLVNGDYTGSWKYVPKDLTMAVWGGGARPESLRFFAAEGFLMLISCYYDADDLNDVKEWLRLAATTPKVQGFMYTTWQRKYGLLGEFGRLLRTGE